MANFMIRFLLCNVFISGIVGILLIAKWVFRNNLSSRMQYNLWLLLLGLLAVPFIPFRLISFPQIFSWLSSVRNSSASHADVGANNVMDTGLSGTTNWMNDFALSVNKDTTLFFISENTLGHKTLNERLDSFGTPVCCL
jgi:bla regulator protein blaR1